jgi:hypothetical protein
VGQLALPKKKKKKKGRLGSPHVVQEKSRALGVQKERIFRGAADKKELKGPRLLGGAKGPP